VNVEGRTYRTSIGVNIGEFRDTAVYN